MYNKNNFAIEKVAREGKPPIVQIHPRFTAATDGYVAVIITAPNNNDNYPVPENEEMAERFEPFSISCEDAKRVEDQIPNVRVMEEVLNNAIVLKSEGDTVKFHTTDLSNKNTIVVEKQKRTYHYGSIFPHSKSTRIRLQTRLIKKAIDTISQVQGKGIEKTPYIDVDIYGPDKAIKITAKNTKTNQKITALIMPMYPRR
jgi:hypothetical protein